MTTQIKRRRGSTTQHASFTGAEGELTIDTTKDTVVVHDGSTAGGHPLAKESSITGKVDKAGDTMTGDLTVPNVIVSGTVDGRDISADGATLDAIEANADVTDVTNVTAAGALMDSEVTNLAQVKAFDATDYATSAQGTLAASAVQPNDSAALKELDLNAIATDISDTAVDVFVYDTSKDSDGGAWRKRTQGTSWYNETLNTATRGSRKEFPAVAVVVAESNQVTIYDGDDPDMPMWMVFNASRTPTVTMLNWFTGSQAVVSSVAQLNGRLCVGTDGGVTQFDFVEDAMYLSYSPSTAYTPTSNRISSRNDSNASSSGSSNENFYFIVNTSVNDVAMTVLPNAPIDAATGLPAVTVAVATNGGVSVIRDDGTVVDLTYTVNGTNESGSVNFTEGNGVAWSTRNLSGTYAYLQHLHSIPASDYSSAPDNVYERDVNTVPGYNGSYMGKLLSIPNGYAAASTSALTLFNENKSLTAAGMNAYVTSSYATGWMNGDIKLATLSDTDDTDVTGSELVTNGTFDTDTSGWTAEFSTISVTSGTLQVVGTSNFNYATQTVTGLTVGKKYVFQADIVTGSGNTYIYVRRGDNGGGITNGSANGVGSYALTFEAPTTSVKVRLYQIYQTTSTFDNISVRLAEEDRSVNGNGLQVFGTVTKSEKVATNADLVAYGGFSSAVNYLEQPHNPDITFSAGADYSITWWMKTSSTSALNVWMKGKAGNSQLQADDFLIQMQTDGVLRSYPRGSGSWDAQIDSASVNDGVWHCVALVRRGSTLQWYVDGVAGNIGTHSRAFGSSTSVLRIGRRTDSTASGYSGRLALFRISATAPSPEQIAKIYNDEKVLFQEGAQATLYGSSATADAVTALAYDDTTELLHVGTSAGRSDFQGLRRVNNTTNAVGAAISASNGMIVEE